jgi:hypothetical protein
MSRLPELGQQLTERATIARSAGNCDSFFREFLPPLVAAGCSLSSPEQIENLAQVSRV